MHAILVSLVMRFLTHLLRVACLHGAQNEELKSHKALCTVTSAEYADSGTEPHGRGGEYEIVPEYGGAGPSQGRNPFSDSFGGGFFPNGGFGDAFSDGFFGGGSGSGFASAGGSGSGSFYSGSYSSYGGPSGGGGYSKSTTVRRGPGGVLVPPSRPMLACPGPSFHGLNSVGLTLDQYRHARAADMQACHSTDYLCSTVPIIFAMFVIIRLKMFL